MCICTLFAFIYLLPFIFRLWNKQLQYNYDEEDDKKKIAVAASIYCISHTNTKAFKNENKKLFFRSKANAFNNFRNFEMSSVLWSANSWVHFFISAADFFKYTKITQQQQTLRKKNVNKWVTCIYDVPRTYR